MKQAGVSSFSVSLNAPNEELYNKIVQPKKASAFENTLRFVQTVKKLGFNVKVTFVNIPLLNEHLPHCIKLAETLGVDILVREPDIA